MFKKKPTKEDITIIDKTEEVIETDKIIGGYKYE